MSSDVTSPHADSAPEIDTPRIATRINDAREYLAAMSIQKRARGVIARSVHATRVQINQAQAWCEQERKDIAQMLKRLPPEAAVRTLLDAIRERTERARVLEAAAARATQVEQHVITLQRSARAQSARALAVEVMVAHPDAEECSSNTDEPAGPSDESVGGSDTGVGASDVADGAVVADANSAVSVVAL